MDTQIGLFSIGNTHLITDSHVKFKLIVIFVEVGFKVVLCF